MIKSDRVIPSCESSNCSFCERRSFTAADVNDPFLYYPIYAGHYVALEHYYTDRSWLGSLLVLYTESGEAAVSVDDGEFIRMRPGSVLVLDCRRHHIYYPVKAPWEFFYIHIAGRDCLSFAGSLAHNGHPVYEYGEANRAEIKSLIEKALSAPDEISFSLDLSMSALIYRLLTVLLDRSDDVFDKDASETVSKLNLAEEYMREHISEPISTELLAGRLYLTRPYFSALFRRYYGLPPHQYLTFLRIGTAKQLLVETDLTVGVIAEKVGYTDVSAFTRCFSRITGMTPGQFRGIRQ